jgi:glyoxylate reductase
MKVFITSKIPQIGIDLLQKKGYELKIHNKPEPISESNLIKQAKDSDAILSMLTLKINKSIIESCKNLKVISNFAVGYNNIDVEYATQKGIAVTNTPGVLTEATANIAMSLILATSRRIIESDKFMREGKFKGWEPLLLLGQEIKDKTLGILGAGRIGESVARKAYAFGMKIIYNSVDRNESMDNELRAKKVSLDTLVKKSDILSLHIPLTPMTFHIIGNNELLKMKPTSIIINTARGEVVDEKFLIEMLKKKKIYAAGFDVYEGEPKVNTELLKLENVVVLPHIGSATIETRNSMAIIAANNIISVLSKKPAAYTVNPLVYKK